MFIRGTVLTRKELAQAYFECQLDWDMEYITDNLWEQYRDGDDAAKIDMEKLRTDEDYCRRVATRYRKYLEDSYGSDLEWSCFKDAVRYVDEIEKIYQSS